MSLPFASSPSSLPSNGQQPETSATRDSQMNSGRSRPMPTLLAFLYGDELQTWTKDHLLLEAHVQYLIGQVSPHTSFDRDNLLAEITGAVEQLPSLFQDAANRAATSERSANYLESGYTPLWQPLYCQSTSTDISCRLRRSKRLALIATALRNGLIENANHVDSDTEDDTEDIQDDSQQGVFPQRLRALRERVARNHANLIRGIPTDPYNVPIEFLDAEWASARKYNRLAEMHDCQGQLSVRLMEANFHVSKTEIKDEMREWDVAHTKAYVRRLAFFYQRIGKRPGHPSRSVPQKSSARRITSTSLGSTEEGIRSTSSTPSSLQYSGPREKPTGGESPNQSDLERRMMLRRNDGRLNSLRKCLQRNNERLARGAAKWAKPFKGRRLESSAGHSQLTASNQLRMAIRQQVRLSHVLSESRDMDFKARAVEFAKRWTSEQWRSKICKEYEKDFVKSFGRYINASAPEADQASNQSLSEKTSSSGSTASKPSYDAGQTEEAETSGAQASPSVVQNESHPATARGTSSACSSNGADIFRSGDFMGDASLHYPAQTPTTATRLNGATSVSSGLLARDTVPNIVSASKECSTPASAETGHSSSSKSEKKINVCLSLPNDTTSAPRRLIWTPDLNRDGFFSKVKEKFSDGSVNAVEVFINDDRILIEPTGCGDEWTILQEELCGLFSQHPDKKLQVSAVVQIR